MPFKKFDVDKAIVEKFGSIEEFNTVCERLDIEEKLTSCTNGEMIPKLINGRWYIEISSKEFGKVLMFENNSIDIISFDSEIQANEYIKTNSIK